MQGRVSSQSEDVEMASDSVTETAPDTTASVEDAASSLRAAALLTLKFKRRKPTDQAARSLARPTADNSVQLDYGQEEVATSPPENLPPQSPPSKVPQIDMEDGQIREDGEISDSEPAAVAAAHQGPTPTSSPNKHSASSAPSLDVHSESVHNNNSPSSVVFPKAESPPNLLDRISDVPLPASESFGQPQSLEGNKSQFFVDVDHVRPGLEMNQEQYDTAKDIVLDLLGWGVPPEYLVDCGLSREIVFYVFSELNLRLPTNLDTSGIIPYSPFTLKTLLRDPNRTLSPLGSESGSQRLSGHPSLPLKPSAPGSRKVTGDAAGAAALHDMERQRRQELLARKAVQASRRNAGSTSPTTKPAAANDQDIEMTSLAPSESVDDFLKSIEPVRSDRMDVDELPGGLSLASSIHDMAPQESMPMSESPIQATEEPPISSGASPSGQTLRRSSSSDDTTSGLSNGVQRRAGKRPVAADFVDFDAPQHRNGSSTRPKSGGSFASISTMRRCVIDLSDSEGETDGHDDHTAKRPGTSRYSTPPTSSAGTSNHRTMSPAALAAKELEIQKMRQMIAEREQGRVKKLKKLEAMSNPDGFIVKQEEEDLTTALTTPVNETEPPATSTNTASSATSIAGNDSPIPTSSDNQETNSETGNDQATSESHNSSMAEAVDVDLASSSSAQMMPALLQHLQKPEERAQQAEKHEDHATYISIFDSYPLLRFRSQPLLQTEHNIISLSPTSFASSSNPSSTNTSLSSSSHSVSYTTPLSSFFVSRHFSPFLLPDLRPLRLATISQLLDSSKRLCQYEIPGGGICRDVGCDDIHISRLGDGTSISAVAEPGDQDTANYLSTVVPDSWVTAYGSSLTSRIVATLEDIRLNYPTLTLEARVARVCDVLEPHSPTT